MTTRTPILALIALALIAGVSMAAPRSEAATGDPVLMNEVVVSTASTDIEFLELYGTPGASLAGLSIIVIEGDNGSPLGRIDARFDFAPGQEIGPNGFFLVGNGLVPGQYGVTPNATIANDFFENSSHTIALVTTASVGAVGTTVVGTEVVRDSIAFTDGGVGDTFYLGAPVFGPDGTFLPAGARRLVDGVDTDVAADWVLADFNHTTNTPTAAPPPVPTALEIEEIQGAAHTSPYDGELVETSGLVTAIVGFGSARGFYLQEPDATRDADAATSAALFVFTGAATPAVAVGDALDDVVGTVTEFSFTNELSKTQLTGATWVIASSGNTLPAPQVIGTGGRIAPTEVIEDDAFGSFEPATDGLDFYESMEAMRVQVNDAVAVSSNARFGEIAVLADGGLGQGPRSVNGGINIDGGADYNPERIIVDDFLITAEPDVKVGDTFDGAIVGVLDYSFANFKLYNTVALPPVIPALYSPEITTLMGDDDQLTIATFNVENLALTSSAQKYDDVAARIVNNLGSPDIVALQEIQDNSGPADNGVTSASDTLEELVDNIVDAGGPAYEWFEIAPENNADGGAPGANIRVAYLYNPARVTLVERGAADYDDPTTPVLGGSGVELTLSPGRIDPANPIWADGGGFEGTRKPLAAEFEFNGEKVFVVNNHFKSKTGDTGLFGAVQPPLVLTEAQRILQGALVNDFVESILALDPSANVIVLGDLNEFEFALPITALAGDALLNLVDTTPIADRHTFNFDGNGQALDHILIPHHLACQAEVDIVHANIDFPATGFGRSGDHDPIIARVHVEPGASACGYLGDNNGPGNSPDRDVFEFHGTRGEQVTITLEPGFDFEPGRAALSLEKKTGGHFNRSDNSEVPNQIVATLPFTGRYEIVVTERFGANGFEGGYWLTLASSGAAETTLTPLGSVE
ncbi:MAG TPA: endonuclease/exonuclease/phosphatase family protein [Tepidiformaceae bacterium]|nr:endonuclease/exonuclease/phosphatase family protein [Tepidiformaceae bacterium]